MPGTPRANASGAQVARKQDVSTQLLALLSDFESELYPRRASSLIINLDSSLDRELGIDSLARVELLYRLESQFGIGITEQAFAAAETPRDLLQLVLSSEDKKQEQTAPRFTLPDSLSGAELPNAVQTLSELLEWQCERHEQRTHLLLYEADDKVTPISYGSLFEDARKVAAGLSERGFLPGQTAAIMLATSREYFFSFFGILLAGGIPVPIYPPARLSQIEDHLKRHAVIMHGAGCSVLITSKEIAPVAHLLQAQVTSMKSVVTADELVRTGKTGPVVKRRGGDIAFLQYTSGSTGNPKGVKLTHYNLLTNIRAMGEAVRADSSDVFVSWLPLYHDMGLIGAWLGSLYHAFPLVVMSPLMFLSRPQRWLWAIHQHGGTLSAAPNFAYELCLSKIDDAAIEGLDLSSWRMAFNGAEPVSPKTIKRFSDRFRPYGFRPEAMAPVYGLAESSVGLAFPPPGRIPPVERLRRDKLDQEGVAVLADDREPEVLEVVACGQPLREHQIRIVDNQGRELPDRRVGNLQFKGPSTTSGYMHNPEATEQLFDDGWLNSGDLAYVSEGDVYLTGRVKDMIIRAGRNIYPHELEERIGDIEGIRKGCVAVFGSLDAAAGTERLVIIAETRSMDEMVHSALNQEIAEVTNELTGTPADEVVLAPPHTVLKTSSGKIRRAATRQGFEQGLLSRKQRSVWLQFYHLLVSGVKPQWYRLKRAVRDNAYAVYAWLVFILVAAVVWIVVALLPRRDWRWAFIRRAARFLMMITGIRMVVHGTEHITPDKPAIIVSNHASYLDGVFLVAGLPGQFVVVAKKELQSKLIPRVFLERVGVIFVERFQRQHNQQDLAELNKAIGEGSSLLFFPEGTFSRMPGLLPFRMGAFVTAAVTGLPIVPTSIRGTRSLLRAGSWFPRRVPITIVVSPGISASGTGWEETLRLREEVRAEILKWCGEPDLSSEIVTPESE